MDGCEFVYFCRREVMEGGSMDALREDLRGIAECAGAVGKGPKPWINAAQERYFKGFMNKFVPVEPQELLSAPTEKKFLKLLNDCGDSMVPAAYSLLAESADGLPEFLKDMADAVDRAASIAKGDMDDAGRPAPSA